MKKAIAGVAVLGLVCFAAGCDEDRKAPEPAGSAAAAPATESAPPAPMEPKATPAELEAKTMKGLVDAWNTHDAKKVAAAYEPQGRLVIPGLPDFPDRAAIEAEAKGDFTAYSDFKVAVTKSYVHGNTVAIEWVITGKNDGPMMGKPASGRQMGVAGASVSRFDDDGFIKEEHRYVDLPTITNQLDPKAKAGTFRPPVALPTGAMETLVSKGTPDEAKALDTAKAFYAAFEGKKEADFSALVTDDSTFDDLTGPAQAKGAKAGLDMARTFWKAIPDLAQTKPVQFAAGDVVVTEGVLTGTQKGALGPLKASNKPVSLRFVDFVKVKDGKAASLTTYADSAEMLTEIGAMPPLGAAPAASASAAPPAPSAKAK
jgi:steroid delta-isomerase-like uncharacterized protein